VAADVWSVTSYKELHLDALHTERWNLLHPDKKPKTPYVTESLKNAKGIFVAASDYVKALPESISKWLPGPLYSLGTDGFGRSDGRRHLRNFFEVDERYIVLAALYMLMKEGSIKSEVVTKAIKEMDIDTDKANPMIS
jgi:pyruvate dehydrogenase E1 component